VQLEFDRIVARLGAATPTELLGSACGTGIEGEGPNGPPVVSDLNQSVQVPGLFVIGAARGSPLIKECLDEGYRVVETILGNPVSAADEELIRSQLSVMGLRLTPTDILEPLCRAPSPFAGLGRVRLHRLLVQGNLRQFSPGDRIFARGDYTTSLYVVLAGDVEVRTGTEATHGSFRPAPGQFLGEVELMSGRRRRISAAAIGNCLLLELESATVSRLARQFPELGLALERAAILHQIQADFAPGVPEELLLGLARTAQTVRFQPQTRLLDNRKPEQPVYILRRGAVTISSQLDGKPTLVDYLEEGDWIGGGSVVDRLSMPHEVAAASDVEAIKLDNEALRSVLERFPPLGVRLRKEIDLRRGRWRYSGYRREIGHRVEFLLQEDLPTANDVLVIDASRCIGCDNCEKACAETHSGIARFDRQSGTEFAGLHLPAACRHCDDAPCQEVCPAAALRRAPSGEIFVDMVACLGCGDCEKACPHDAIEMASVPQPKPGLLKWLLFGSGPGPGEDKSPGGVARRTGRKLPAKCDLCRDLAAGPACVRACPTGAVFRSRPKELIISLVQSPARIG
jgi:Fe-S-cluster-containing hydrogenase component 2/CRP-like cAMP-binding protein